MSAKKFVIVKFSTLHIDVIPTSFDREPGFVMSVDGRKGEVVGMLFSQEERDLFVIEWNRRLNRVKRIEQANFNAQFWNKLYNNNPIIRDCIDTLNSKLYA